VGVLRLRQCGHAEDRHKNVSTEVFSDHLGVLSKTSLPLPVLPCVIRRATRFPLPAHPVPHGTRVGFTASVLPSVPCKRVPPTPNGPSLRRGPKLQHPPSLPSLRQLFRRSIRSVGPIPIFGPCHDSGVKRALAVDGALIPTTNLTAIPP